MLQKSVILFLSFIVLSCTTLVEISEPAPENDYKLQVIYMVPLTYNYSQTNIDKAATATLEIQRFIQAATGGKTFEILNEEEILSVYFSNRRLEDYEDNWLSFVKLDLQEAGYDVEAKGTITMVWIDGIDSLTEDSLTLREVLCEGECGMTLLPIRTVLAGDWLPTDLSIPIHELGHLYGLEHPVEAADLPLAVEEQVILASFMSPNELRVGATTNDFGFLTTEKEILKSSLFLKPEVPIYQRYWSSIILNYPSTGAPPDASFGFDVSQFAAVEFSVAAPEGHEFYWYFGDGSTSSEREPAHNYRTGIYNVTLMVTSPNNMSSRYSQYIEVP
jgi:hypothetical protein